MKYCNIKEVLVLLTNTDALIFVLACFWFAAKHSNDGAQTLVMSRWCHRIHATAKWIAHREQGTVKKENKRVEIEMRQNEMGQTKQRAHSLIRDLIHIHAFGWDAVRHQVLVSRVGKFLHRKSAIVAPVAGEPHVARSLYSHSYENPSLVIWHTNFGLQSN